MKVTKEEGILRLLDKLDVPGRGWIIVDHWEADLCAIGFAHPDRPRNLVYVSTFDRARDRYDYECEAPRGESPEEFTTVDSDTDVDFEALVNVLEKHLGPHGDRPTFFKS